MSSKAPTQTVKATSVIKKKTKEEQLLEALEQARAEGAEATELASVDTSNLLAQAPAAVASDAAATSTAATSTAGTTTAATTATAAGGAAAVSTGVVVAGVAGATVVAVAASNASSKNDTTVAKDTTAPTATITLSDSALKKGETATVTVTFSEAVTGFSNADLTLTSGALSDMSSSDGGKTWTGTFTPTDDYEDATNVISLATTYTDAAGNTGTTATSANYTVDTKLPVIQSLSANGDDKTVTLTYSEILDATNIPATTAFAIQVNGVDNAVTQVVANGATLVLTLTDTFTTGQNVLVTYTDADGDGTTTIQDTAGNDAVGFTQGVVADGYIRDAQMYLDAPSGLVELTGVKTDANGNFFLPQGINPNGYALVAVGGVNIDTGLPNTTPMKAPAGSTTINPLTTLVQAVIQQATEQGLTVTPETAALNVANALGLKLPKDKTLNNYDPLSATDGDPVAAQKAAAQIATLTTLAAEAAGSSDAQTAATSVLKNIANVVLSGNTETVSLSDSSVLTQALSDVTLNESQQAAIVEANTAIAAADTITAISTAQSQFVDKIAPDAPTAISIATLTKDNTPAVEVSLNTKSTDGKAAVAGDTLVILDGTTEVANITITAAHLAAGKVVIDNLPTLSEGSHTLTAKLTDKAGNASDISNASTVVVDTTGPSVVISSATDNLAAGASTTLTMTFTEAVAGLTASDLQVSGGGTVSNLAKVSDTVYTATYTAPTTGGAGYVYIAKGSYTDVAGNNGASSNTLDLAAVNPPVLSINTIGGADKVISAQKGDNLITGTAQASNGNVTVKFGDTVLGTATVATNGTWSYSLTTDNLTTIGQAGEASITAEQTRTVSGTDYTGKSAEFFFAVDTLAPTTSLSVSGLSTNDSVINTAEKAAGVLVSGTAETGSTVQLTVGTTVKTLSTTGGAWSYTLTNADYKELAKMTSPSVSAIAIDAAGNKSDAVTQAFSIDTTAPTMGFVKLTDSTDTGTKADGRTSNKTPSIEFTAESNAVVSVSVDGGKTFSTETTTGTGLLQTLTLPTLSEGVNAIVVKAVDAAGNESIRTTSIVIDSTAPTIADATPSTPENSDASKVVYTATSTDASVVSYALKQGLQDNAGHFTIESKTGKVTLKDNPNYEDIPSYSFTVVATDAAGNTSEKAVTLSITDVNEAPTAVAVTNGTISIAENTVIASAMKVADIAITDDALGTNSITLTGADAANFEVMGNALYLKAGTSLNFEAKAKYDVTVNVADSSVTGSTPVTANYSLTVTDVNEAPTAVAVTNATLSIAENTPITNPMKVADIAITDDALGTNSITLSGADAANFEVMGNALYLKAGTNLNFEAQNKLDVTVNVADASLTGSTPVTANYSLAVTNVNEAPVASKNYQSTERIVNGQALTDFTFVPDFVDPEGDNLSFTYSGTLPAGLTFTNGVVSGTPTTDGNYTFTVTASDGSLTHSQDYTVSVVSAPVVQSMTITDTEGETSTGKQGDTLFIDLKLSEAVTLNQGEGAFTITLDGAASPFNANFVRLSEDGTTLTFSGTAPSGNTSALELASLNLNGTTITGNTTNVALVYTRVSASYTLDNTLPADAVISVGGADSVLNATEATNATSIGITPDTGATVSSVTLNTQTITAQSNGAYVFDATQLEQNTENSVTVVTVDAAGNSKTTTKTFTVDTIAPTFQSGATANAIVENTGANQIVYQAMSNDSGAKYSLKAGSDTGLSIDANTGEVKLLANPNYEAKSSYSFTVVATDTAGNFSEQALTLAITNANDAPTGGVTISGVPTIGATLTANNTLADEDGITAAGISYQWYANGAGIEGATGNTFELTNTYLGQNISVAAIYTDGLDNTTRVVSNPTAPVADLVSLPGGLQVTPTGSYQYTDYYYGAVTFNTNTETTWTPAEGETVIGLTSHYVTTPSYYNYKDIVVQNTTGDYYSIYSFLANSNTLTLESATPTPLTSAQVASLAITWNADLLGSGLLVQSETPIVQDGTGGTAIYAYTNETVTVYALVSAMSTSSYVIVAQNADGSLWLPAQDTTPKALAYNPINGTMNLYYTENGVAKFVTFSQKDQVATAGTVNTMGTKGIETAESFTGVDINGNGKIESVTIANKWAIPNYNSNTYLVKTTDANTNSIFGLVIDNPTDDISLATGTTLQSFMKLFKTNDGATAWTPGSTDLSVKSIQPVYTSSATSTSATLTGFEVLIQNNSTEEFTMWTFGTDGNATTTTAQAVSTAKLYAFEQAAQQDFNADGMIGTTNSVNITTGNIIATLQNAGNFTTSTGWKLGSETNVSFTSSTAGNVTYPDGQGGTTTVPFTLTNGAIVFTLPDNSTASYKLLANNTNMIVLASTTPDVTAAMNIDQNGPAPIMTIYKDTLTSAQALPTQALTLYTSKTENFGDWQSPVSLMLDPTTNKVSFTDIWGVTKTTNFTVSNNARFQVITAI